MKARSLKEFSGIPKGTTGNMTYNTTHGDWEVTWDLQNKLTDCFDDWEKDNYLEILK